MAREISQEQCPPYTIKEEYHVCDCAYSSPQKKTFCYYFNKYIRKRRYNTKEKLILTIIILGILLITLTASIITLVTINLTKDSNNSTLQYNL